MQLRNFGCNLQFEPDRYYEPLDEQQVLEILKRHRGKSIRVVGKLHSWSAAPVGEGIVLSLKHLQEVAIDNNQHGRSAWVGAGCQIKTLLQELAQHGLTLPSVGLITEQTIVGAISTGTHGSGRHSLSHYVEAVRIARYHTMTGEVVVEEVTGGDELRAARCSLGCLGVILSVRIQCRPQYSVEEHWREYQNLDQALQGEDQYPLQQFFLLPWRWTFLVQHRRELPSGRSHLAWLYRIYWFVFIDLGMHLFLMLSARVVQSRSFVHVLFRHVLPAAVVRNWKVIDNSSEMLVMEHELFRHIEMELFVRDKDLPQALEHVRGALVAAGDGSMRSHSRLTDAGVMDCDAERLDSLRGRYCHHYPICVRRVLADDTLISMAAGEEQVWYTISLVSYARPTDRQGFQKVAEFLAETMAKKFGARPHWGKWCPLTAQQLVSLYSRFDDFRTVCESRDPKGVFRNPWLSTLFGDRGLR